MSSISNDGQVKLVTSVTGFLTSVDYTGWSATRSGRPDYTGSDLHTLSSDYLNRSFETTANGLFNTTFNCTIAKGPKPPSVPEYPGAWLYFAPFVFVVGLVGNILTVLVMRRRRMKNSTTSVYLSLMAIADSAALFTRISPEFFKACNMFVFSELNRWTCKTEKFVFYTTSDIAIWILVCFTVDRLIAVCLPLYKQRFCKPRKAAIVCLVIAILCVIKNVHVFWTREVEYNICGRVKKICGRPYPYYYFEEFVRPWIAFALISAVPFLIIVICNFCIILSLVRVRRQSLHGPPLVPSLSKVTKKPTLAMRSTSKKMTRKFTQTTLMCLSASIAFLICVTPSIVLTLGRVHWSVDPHRVPYGVAKAVNNQLSCLNHAINFFLYCITGQRFRHELIAMLRCRKDIFGYSSSRYTVNSGLRPYTTRSSSSGIAFQVASPVSLSSDGESILQTNSSDSIVEMNGSSRKYSDLQSENTSFQ